MDRCRRTRSEDHTIIRVLADIARELASTQAWELQVTNALGQLSELLPQGEVAAGFLLQNQWKTFQPNTETVCPELTDELRQHFLALSGDTQAETRADYECEWHGRLETLALTASDQYPGSFLSVPIASDGHILGVLHARSNDDEAYSPDEVDLLSIVASQLGTQLPKAFSGNDSAQTCETTDTSTGDDIHCLKELDTLVEVLADAVVVFDEKSNPVRANAVVASELGFDPRTSGLVESLRQAQFRYPDGTTIPFRDMITSRALRGETVKAEPMILRGINGDDRHVVGSASPVEVNGKIVGAISTWHDITRAKLAQTQRERHLGQMETLLRVSAEMLAETTLQGLLQKTVDVARELTGAMLGVSGYGGEDGNFATNTTSSLDGMHHPHIFDNEYGHIRFDFLGEGSAVRLSEEQIKQHPQMKNVLSNHVPVSGLLCAPLIGQSGTPNGQVVVAHRAPADFTQEDEALIKQLAVIASLGIRHIEARLDAERRAAEAEGSKRVLEALLEHIPDGVAIADAPNAAIRAMSKRGLEMIGVPESEAATTGIEDAPTYRTMWHSDGLEPASIEETPLVRAIRQGENISNEEWLLRGPDGTEIPILCNAGPIRDRNGVTTGGIVTYRDITDVKETRDALEAAYRREHHISEVLQQALLPPVSLDTAKCQVAAEYHSALVEAEVGGDFYDVFDVGEGWMALVMGDVSGKGLSAAVYTSMAKYMIRAYAHEDAEPKSVLRRLNEALAEFMPDETFITIFYGLLDTNRHILAYANAGHEPPLVYGNGLAAAIELDVTGPAVGMIPKVDYGQRVMPILPGSVLVIYTDGITDSRHETKFFGIEGLAQVISDHADNNARSIASAIHKAALRHSQGHLDDDAALLVIKQKARA